MKLLPLLLICMLAVSANTQTLQLFWADTDPNGKGQNSLFGSVFGGTVLYINGLGFNTDATQNQVFIGTFPCIISAAGVTTNSLTCTTTSTNQNNEIDNLIITVFSGGQKATFPVEQCGFNYSPSKTPTLYNSYPATAVAGTLINYFGVHRISNVGDGQLNLGDIIAMRIGQTQCSRFGIVQNSIAANSLDTIKCTQAPQQEAGKYNLTELLVPGLSIPIFKMQRSSMLLENYQFAVLPAISAISPNSGSAAGQLLSITGSGFSLDKTKVSVSVDGIPCAVVDSTLTNINCQLAKKNNNASTALPTNSASQQQGYYSGNGLAYTRYNLGSIRGIANFQNSYASLTVLESGFRGEIETGDYYGSYYGEVFKGYFTAPVSGTYTFRGVGDDEFSVSLSSSYGSAEVNTTMLIFSNQPQYLQNFYQTYVTTAEGSVTLVANQSYYIIVFHTNYGGSGFLRVSVQVPNINTALTWQTHAVHRLTLNITNDPQIIEFNQTGLTSGKLLLKVLQKNAAGAITYSANATVNYNATIDQFISALGAFTMYTPYRISGVLILTDVNGLVTNDSTNATTYCWRIYVERLRTLSMQKLIPNFTIINSTGIGKLTITTIQPHCPLMSGTFSLNFGGLNITTPSGSQNIPYGVSSSDLQKGFNKIIGFENVQVDTVWNDAGYSVQFIITYYGYNGLVPHLIPSNANLAGGKTNTKPQVYAEVLREYASDLLVDPIDYPFLKSSAAVPNVLVTVNSLLSVCLTNCAYTFTWDTPLFTSLSLSGSKLNIAISSSSYTYTLSDVSIIFNGSPCPIVDTTAPISNFQCQLPINSDNTPTQPFGSYFPTITIDQIGTIGHDPSVQPLPFPISLTSVGPNSGSTNGGYQVTLTGTGFPLSANQCTVSVCGQLANIVSINNIMMTIIMPKCDAGSQDITITATTPSTQTTNSVVFTYTEPMATANVYSISPQSANPSLKGVMQIVGTGFGTDLSAITIYLSNASGNVYQMRVLTINNTNIQAGISGGLSGAFEVKLYKKNFGAILPSSPTATQFTYELVINSISPTTGSYYGGTLINLKGINFATNILQTLVFVGDAMNWICDVESVTSTDILCRTPPINPDYNVSDPQLVLLTNRLIVDNTCPTPANCQFTYIAADASPQITSISLKVVTSGTGSLNIMGLNFGSNCQVVLVNQFTNTKTVLTPTSANSTSASVNIPSVSAGLYTIAVRNDPLGESNRMEIQINKAISMPTTGSLLGGKLTITGKGLPESWPDSNWIIQIKSANTQMLITVNVLSTSPTQLVLAMPPSTGDTFTISITDPANVIYTNRYTQSLASTPTINLTSTTTTVASGSASTFTLNRTSPSASILPTLVSLVPTMNIAEQILVPFETNANTTLINIYATLPAGSYGFKVYYSEYGWANCNGTIMVTTAKPNIAETIAGFNGGMLTLSGSGISPYAKLKINGFTATLTNVTDASATALVPPLITTITQSAYSLTTPSKLLPSQFTTISDTPSAASLTFDGTHSTSYFSTGATCYVGIDVGAGLVLQATRIRYFPYSRWAVAANYLFGSIFEGSNDNSVWKTISTVAQDVHAGWNTIQVKATNTYRYLRFRHTSVSQCRLAELQFSGIVFSTATVLDKTSVKSDVVYSDGANTFTWTKVVEYRDDHTPIINTLSKPNGDVFGGYNLTLSGSALNFDTSIITIDGQPCTVFSSVSSSTSLTCAVSPRLTLPSSNSFSVQIGNIPAILHAQFIYVMRWSDIRTWGTDLPPIDGDFVDVPLGMTLLVDQSTPKLKGILVENGTLLFSDETDITVTAETITVVGGKLIAGTQTSPYQHKLTFVMTGNYYSTQQPMFGNKVIACMECQLSLYGQVRTPTWTMLQFSIAKGDYQFIVMEDIDWQVGESIVVASTSYVHQQSQQRIITAVNNRTVTVNSPFVYSHLGVTQVYDADKLNMRAEVGLLTRNIKMMGDDTSVTTNYGAHLMLSGSSENGLIGHIAYTEFTDCGQPQFVGRYCIHFHMNGDASQSYAIGNAVHHSMARVITLHGVHYLKVSNNVGYLAHGHNFFIEDGIQTNNILQDNLAISSLTSFTMLQTDISVASFWVTHPTNDLLGNHAAGSDFYGIWYEIKPHPDGPSASADVCPMGNPLGLVTNNVAHSNVRFGLRIFQLSPRTYPCSPVFKQDAYNPWQDNPPVLSTFYNFTLYRNMQSGLLAQRTGSLVFNGFIISDSVAGNMEFFMTEYTNPVVLVANSTLIGTSQDSTASINNSTCTGIITPRLGVINMTNIHFYNFGTQTSMLKTCSKCDQMSLKTNSAQQIFLSGFKATNISGNYLHMLGLKREIIYDTDGSYAALYSNTPLLSSATLVAQLPHLQVEQSCRTTTNAWDNSLLCDNTITIRKVIITNSKSEDGIKVQQLTDYNQTLSLDAPVTALYSNPNGGNSFALPYVTGRIYKMWWYSNTDFNHLTMQSTDYYTVQDAGIVFKFDYILNREEYLIGPIRPNQPLTNESLFTQRIDYVNTSTCYNGEYYHNNDIGNRTLQLCASGKNKTYFQTTDVTAVFCRYLCPQPDPSNSTFVKQSFVRLWSNYSQWPGGVMPAPGDNITIYGQWTIRMDIQPTTCGMMVIDGDVYIDDSQNITISCKSIWIRAGSLNAGNGTAPFEHQLIIQLEGPQTDHGYVIDEALEGSKMLVVTGILALYGTAPATVFTPLQATAFAGDSNLIVGACNGWAIGDELVIAPSFSSNLEYQRVTITNIDINNVTITPALKYTHYGDVAPTISLAYGSLDTRANVGHVTRNIKIVSGPTSDWGYQLIVYATYQEITSTSLTGQLIVQGVQFQQGGQRDTTGSTLQFIDVRYQAKPSLITLSSFSNCLAKCITISNTDILTVSQNVFANARQVHIQASTVTNIQLNNNLMIGAVKRPIATAQGWNQIVACLTLSEVDPTTDNLKVMNNICQGSIGVGFVLPLLPCSMMSQLANNVAGSCSIGFILNKVEGDCMSFSGVRAYACGIGQIVNPPNTLSLSLSNFILADNGRAATLRFGLQNSDKTAYFSNSYITALSRPNCQYCYGTSAITCTGNYAIRLLTTTINGETFPTTFDSSFDTICQNQAFDAKAFLSNIVFDSYLLSYPNLPQCSNNVVFKPHSGAFDQVGSHHLANCSCTNCDITAYAYFTPPVPSQLGWAGGCGTILCTGRNNYYIHDTTGTFLPEVGVLIANNSDIGNAVSNCRYIQEINGHYCEREDFSVLEYESIAPDYNTRVMWPVSLTYGNWTTLTNGYREWSWVGSQPQNKRLGRFNSLVQLSQIYNMTFAAMPPLDMRLQLQKRTPQGVPTDWVAVKLYYPFPNSIRITVNEKVITPIVLGVTTPPLNTSQCGSNIFYYFNYTIHFVVTGDPNCMVRVALTNSIQLTAHFTIDINKFYSNNLSTLLIDRMCALFRVVDTSQLKIVGIFAGSTIVTMFLDIPSNSTIANATQDSNNTAKDAQVVAMLQTIQQQQASGAIAADLKQHGFGDLITFTAGIVWNRPMDPVDNSRPLIIGLSVGIFVLVLLTSGLIYYCKLKSDARKVLDNSLPADTSDLQKRDNRIHNQTEENISDLQIGPHHIMQQID